MSPDIQPAPLIEKRFRWLGRSLHTLESTDDPALKVGGADLNAAAGVIEAVRALPEPLSTAGACVYCREESDAHGESCPWERLQSALRQC